MKTKTIQQFLALAAALMLLAIPQSLRAQWAKVINGIMPSNAYVGSTLPDGQEMFIARGSIGGGTHVGKALRNWARAAIPYGTKEEWVGNYEVYTGAGIWVTVSNGAIPGTAVQGGNEAGGKPLYLARAVVGGEMTVGKISRGGSALIGQGGRENPVTKYEILVSNAPSAIIQAGVYQIKTKLNNKNMDVQWGNNAAGTRLHTWDPNNGDAQLFTIEASNEAGYYYIKTNWGLVLDAASPQSGAILHTWGFHGGDNQKWKFIQVGDGSYNIQCKQGGNYLDVLYGNKEQGALIGMVGYSAWNNNVAQRWNLQRENRTTIRLQDINESLCPKDVLQGDREFDGHGPKIQCQVNLRIADEGRAIYANVYIHARETTHDWSTTQRRWIIKVYDAPAGKKIKSINSDPNSYTEFISGAAGGQWFFPGADVAAGIGKVFEAANISKVKEMLKTMFLINPDDVQKVGEIIKASINNGNTVYQLPPIQGKAVRLFQIVGDTGGPDISDDDNCNDDTRIVKIEFNAVSITLE